jgi:hypothetical protein
MYAYCWFLLCMYITMRGSENTKHVSIVALLLGYIEEKS